MNDWIILTVDVYELYTNNVIDIGERVVYSFTNNNG